MESRWNKRLKKIYYDPKHVAGFSNANVLHKVTKMPYRFIKDFLNGEDTYTIHKKRIRNKFFNSYDYHGVFHIWQADLCDLSKLKVHNNGYKYLLGCIDIVSKYAWVEPLKAKNGEIVTKAMHSILKKAKHKIPNKLYVDAGKEFHNNHFKNLMNKYNIHMYATTNVLRHCNVIERFWKTFKSYLFRYMYAKRTKNYLQKLSEMINAYNNRTHSAIKIAPAKVSYENQKQILKRLNGNKNEKINPKYSVGDGVRVLINKKKFEKGYTPNYTLEIFIIDRIHTHMKFPMYFLKTVQNEPIKGGFYEQQLQKVKSSYIYRIEKILKEKKVGRGKRYFVKFLNYSKPEWIKESDLFIL